MLKRSLTYHLASIAEDGIGNATRIFEHRFGWDVYEIRVLRLIRDEPGVTFTRLATLTKFERSAASRMLTRLIRAGLVKRTNSPQDARRFTLTITGKGLAICKEADPLSLALEALMLAPLTPAEKETFRHMLDRVLGWVRGGYAAEVAARFPEAHLPRARPMRKTSASKPSAEAKGKAKGKAKPAVRAPAKAAAAAPIKRTKASRTAAE